MAGQELARKEFELVVRKPCELLQASKTKPVRLSLGISGNVLVDMADAFTIAGKKVGSPALIALGELLSNINRDDKPPESKKE